MEHFSMDQSPEKMTQTIFTSEVRGLRTSEYRKVIYDTAVLMAFYG